MDDVLMQKIKYLRLLGLDEKWDELLTDGDKKQMSLPRFLRHVVDALYETKLTRAKTIRLTGAKIPEPWVMATFPFAKQPKLNKRKVVSLHDSLDYMNKKQNVLLVGPTKPVTYYPSSLLD